MDRHRETSLRPGRFCGEILSASNHHACLLSEATYEADKALPIHSHELAFFCLLIEGAYQEHYPNKSVWYKPFTVVFHSPGESHHVEIGGTGAHVLNIEIQHTLFERLREYTAVPGIVSDLYGGELVRLATRLLREHRAGNTFSPLTSEGLVLEMLAAVGSQSQLLGEGTAPAWLPRLLELLHEEFRQNLRMNYLAAKVGVHPIHLARVFRKYYQQTIHDHIQGLRIQYACRQLSQSEFTLAEIALSAGFHDQSHFTRMFKRSIGYTPGNFRALPKNSRIKKTGKFLSNDSRPPRSGKSK